MPYAVSVTRLRLRAARFVLPFLWHSFKSNRQALAADGGIAVALRRHRGSYWTVSVWRDRSAVRAFMMSGAHKHAMPKLADWCDEAALAHWEQNDAKLPSWEEAERRLAAEGRLSHVRHPSPAQAQGLILGEQASPETALGKSF